MTISRTSSKVEEVIYLTPKSRADVKQNAAVLGARKTFFRSAKHTAPHWAAASNASHSDVHLLQKVRLSKHALVHDTRTRQPCLPPHSTRSRATAHLARTLLRSRPASPMLSTSSRPTSPTCALRFVLCNSSPPARYERTNSASSVHIHNPNQNTVSGKKDRKRAIVSTYTHTHICSKRRGVGHWAALC